MKARIRMIPGLMALMAALLACNLPLGPRDPVEATMTAAIKTVVVGLTGTSAAQTVAAAANGTRVPTLPGSTPGLQQPTAPTARCNWGEFVTDLSIPDGTRLRPGESFTKSWRLKNIGTCTWTPDYSVVFESGSAMGATPAVRITQPVGPGATVDISVSMTAPNTPGRVRGNWKLQTSGGERFGLGSSGQDTFYVEIEVVAATPVIRTATARPTTGAAATLAPTLASTVRPSAQVMDLAARYCEAEWRSSAGILPCPGRDGDANGFVQRLDQPRLQDNQARQSAGLLLVPQNTHNGAVSGRFPSFRVTVGDHFRATLGCAENRTSCNVRFQLNYRVNGGPVQNYGQWDMAYTAQPTNIDLSLTPLANENVELILAVIANGPAEGDWAVWVAPRVER